MLICKENPFSISLTLCGDVSLSVQSESSFAQKDHINISGCAGIELLVGRLQ